jgi:DNA-binding response OmpR family regulator
LPKVLLVGNDLRLLATRAAIVARTHAGVACCTAAEAPKEVQRQKPDLVVLCHSLTDAQAIETTEAARRYSPQTKILMVVPNVVRERFYRGARFDATCPADPGQLLDCIATLLHAPTGHLSSDPSHIAERSA